MCKSIFWMGQNLHRLDASTTLIKIAPPDEDPFPKSLWGIPVRFESGLEGIWLVDRQTGLRRRVV